MVHLCLVDRALVDITTQQKRIRGGSGGDEQRCPDVPLHTIHRPLDLVRRTAPNAKPFHRVVFCREASRAGSSRHCGSACLPTTLEP